MSRPWFAIIWFASWGLFQAYAVSSILIGKWNRPDAFPQEAYHALIYPDMLFIPVYFLTSGLLLFRHKLGYWLGLVSGGAVIYVMIYLLALSKLKGFGNVMADGLFLVINVIAVVQIVYRLTSESA